MFSALKTVDSPTTTTSTFTKRDRLFILGGFALFVLGSPRIIASAAAQDRLNVTPEAKGIHSFFNDDKSQFIDLWLNERGTVTIKVSNGRPWRPMWVVVHASFKSGDTVIGKQDYHVYCPSPNPGGGGAERWFVFNGPNLSGVTSIYTSTNKEKPWENYPDPVVIPIYRDKF